MQQYPDLEDPMYDTVTIESFDIYPTATGRVAPCHFLFGGMGKDKDEKVHVQLQDGEFRERGFTGVPAEAMMLALLKHYEGLKRTDPKCREYNMVVNLLDDAVQSLKGVNDRRAYKNLYGTTKPE